jgi:predicted nucleic acid-binding protein
MILFVDTGAWFALNCRTDENHQAAADFMRRFRREPVVLRTTDYVVDETLTLLRLKVSHVQAVRFLDFLSASPNVDRSMVGPEILARAEKLFRTYRDKRWSFTDCASFAWMDEHDFDDVFTFDHNFTQYGKRVHPHMV